MTLDKTQRSFMIKKKNSQITKNRGNSFNLIKGILKNQLTLNDERLNA